jgi:hypothetical protein
MATATTKGSGYSNEKSNAKSSDLSSAVEDEP